jgi:hypothetical protein
VNALIPQLKPEHYEQRHVLFSSVLSKSILRVACDSICRSFPNIEYFSSYEIVNFGMSMSSYFTGDLRQVSQSGIDHVMNVFFLRYCGVDMRDTRTPAVPDLAWCDEGMVLRLDEAGECEITAFNTQDKRDARPATKAYVKNQIELSQRYPDPYVGFCGAPDGVITNHRSSDEPDGVQLDHLGYWNAFDIRKFMSDRYKRIAVVGSSTIADFSCPVDHTICGFLQRKFNMDGRDDVIVVNCGIDAACATQDLANLLHRVVYLYTASTLFYTGGNDMQGAILGDPRPGYPSNFFIWEEVLSTYKLWTSASAEEWQSASDKYSLAKAEFQDFSLDHEGLRRAAGYRTQTWLDEIVGNYRRVFMKMRAISTGADLKLLLINQPVRASYRLDLSKPHSTLNTENLLEIDAKVRKFLMAKHIIPWSVAGQFIAADWSTMFDDEAVAPYRDRIHGTPDAYEKIAHRMFSELARHFRV